MTQRRTLLQTCGLSTVLATSAALTGCGTARNPSSASDALTETAWNETWDVIVVGSGAAGMTAATALKSFGIERVLIIEKLPVPGGNSSIAVGDICAVDSPVTRRAGIRDSVDLFTDDFTRAGGGFNHRELSRTVGAWSGRGIEFLMSEGCRFSDELMQHFGHSARRIHHPVGGCGQGVLAPLRRAFLEKYGGTLRIRTKMDKILRDASGRAVGLEVREHYDFDTSLASDDLENKSGVTKRYRATKGIVLAFGGYARDPQWRKEDFPLFNPMMVEMASLGATGGGLRAAFAAGARPFGMSFMRYGFDIAGGDSRFFCMVHPKSAERFIDEALPRDPLAEAALLIADETGSFPVCITDSVGLTHFEDPIRNRRMLKLGTLRPYGSLEALARGEGLPADRLRRTVADYNRAVRKGRDDAFGKDFRKAHGLTISKPPYYASSLIPRANNTVGGMLVTTKAEVVSVTDGKPIPGLYAAGECAAGAHGKASLPSASIVVGVTLGLIAAHELSGRSTRTDRTNEKENRS